MSSSLLRIWEQLKILQGIAAPASVFYVDATAARALETFMIMLDQNVQFAAKTGCHLHLHFQLEEQFDDLIDAFLMSEGHPALLSACLILIRIGAQVSDLRARLIRGGGDRVMKMLFYTLERPGLVQISPIYSKSKPMRVFPVGDAARTLRVICAVGGGLTASESGQLLELGALHAITTAIEGHAGVPDDFQDYTRNLLAVVKGLLGSAPTEVVAMAVADDGSQFTTASLLLVVQRPRWLKHLAEDLSSLFEAPNLLGGVVLLVPLTLRREALAAVQCYVGAHTEAATRLAAVLDPPSQSISKKKVGNPLKATGILWLKRIVQGR